MIAPELQARKVNEIQDTTRAIRTYQRNPQDLAMMAFNDPFVAHVASLDFAGTEG